jgi:acetyl-CoA C-acetyltransferase
MKDVVIVGAARTAIGNFGGGLASVPLAAIGGVVIQASLERARLEVGAVDEVVMGNVVGAGAGMNPARQAAVKAGLPYEIPSTTVNKVCGSGLKAVLLAAQAIRAGDSEVGVAGGLESMSRAPYLLNGARWGYRLGHGEVTDALLSDGLSCALMGYHMGVTAENVAERCRISREAQDAYAAESQRRAVAAIEAGRFDDEINGVEVPQKNGGAVTFSRDEFPRAGTTADTLAKLAPAFKKEGGTVTAGNASGINDGAAALVLTSEDRAMDLGREPLAVLRGWASAGVDPAVMGLGPVPAVRKAVARAGLTLGAIDLFELNEAFAAQSLAVLAELELDPQRVNVNGGAIALGHPIGASGARILVTLLYELRRRRGRYGVAGLCIGGGQGIAVVVEVT